MKNAVVTDANQRGEEMKNAVVTDANQRGE